MSTEAKQAFLAKLKEQSSWVYTIERSQKHYLNEKLKDTGINQLSASKILGIKHGQLSRMLNGYDPMSDDIRVKLEALCLSL